jgi:hypothetical protein
MMLNQMNSSQIVNGSVALSKKSFGEDDDIVSFKESSKFSSKPNAGVPKRKSP